MTFSHNNHYRKSILYQLTSFQQPRKSDHTAGKFEENTYRPIPAKYIYGFLNHTSCEGLQLLGLWQSFTWETTGQQCKPEKNK